MNIRLQVLPAVALAAVSLLACSSNAEDGAVGDAVAGAEVIGSSVEGRRITALTIGGGPRTVVVIGGLHTGTEAETVNLVERLQREFAERARDLPRGVRLVFIASANPDGLDLEVRTNAHDVDLNRNWPTGDWRSDATHGDAEVFGGAQPLSEPETTALHDYLLALRPEIVLSIHGFAGVVQHNRQGAAEHLAASFGDAARFDVIAEWPHYQVTGELIEALAEEGISAADVELLENDAESYQRVRTGLEAVIRELGDGSGRS